LKPVRIARPIYNGPLADVVSSPRYATAIGLLEEACQQRQSGREAAEMSASFTDVLKRMKNWFVRSF